METLLEVTHTFEQGPIVVNTSLKGNIHVWSYYDASVSEDYMESETTLNFEGTVDCAATAAVSDKDYPIQLTFFDMPIPFGATGLTAHLRVNIPVRYEFKGEGGIKVSYSSSTGYRHNPVDGYQPISAKTCTGQLHGGAEFDIRTGPEVEFAVGVFANELLEASISGMIGFQATGKLYAKTHEDNYNSTSLHDCDLCLDTQLNFISTIKGSLDYRLTSWLKGSLAGVELMPAQVRLKQYYKAIQYGPKAPFRNGTPTEGEGACPNNIYLATIHVRKEDGQALSGTPVTVLDAGGKQVEAAKSGLTWVQDRTFNQYA